MDGTVRRPSIAPTVRSPSLHPVRFGWACVLPLRLIVDGFLLLASHCALERSGTRTASITWMTPLHAHTLPCTMVASDAAA